MCKSQELKVSKGDLNANFGCRQLDNTVGPFGLGTVNERGEKFVEFCQEKELVIANTWFKQHPRRLWTWAMTAWRSKNQIDYICISQKYPNGLLSAKIYPRTDCGTDHVTVLATLKIKMKRIKKPQTK